MKVLITGGTGFIGSRLALHSLERGYEVTVLGQTNTPAEARNCSTLTAAGARLTLASVTDRDLAFRLTRGQDLVFHLAAAQHEANVPDRHYYAVNVEGTRNMLEASQAGGVTRFVHGSTIGVYGSSIDGEITEQSEVRPDNIYGTTKLEAERLVAAARDKLSVSIIRIAETYGPGDHRLLKLFKAIQKKLFFVIGNGTNKHQPVHVDDLVQGLHLAAVAKQATGEVIILSGPEVLSTRQMVDTIGAALDSRVPRWHAPLWLFTGSAVLMEATLRPLGIQPPLHRRRMDFFCKSFYFSQDKARQLLGYRCERNFHQGVAETADWYHRNGYLDSPHPERSTVGRR